MICLWAAWVILICLGAWFFWLGWRKDKRVSKMVEDVKRERGR